MSAVLSLGRGLWFASCLAAGLCLAAAGRTDARPPDNNLLDQTRKLTTIAAQKAEADVRAALLDAERLALSDQARALDRLRKVQASLEADTVLPDAKRDSLKRVVAARLKAIEAGPPATPPLTEKDVVAATLRAGAAKEQDDGGQVQKALQDLIALQKDGKFAEASKKAEELARQHPGHPAALTAFQTTQAFDQLASAREVRRDKERNTAAAFRDIERSAIPPSGDIEFPKDWKERTERRKQFSVQVPLTPQEKAIIRALNTPVTVNFKQDKFQDAIEYLSTVMGQPIFLDKNALADAQVDYETPVSLSVKNVSPRTILRKILGEFGLTYVIKDGAIQVTSLAKAREMMVVRSYPVADLLNVGGGPGDPLQNIFGPGIGRLQAMQSIASLIDMVQQSVDPQSWQANGGPGAVFFNYATMSLVIKQSAEVHGMISGSFLR